MDVDFHYLFKILLVGDNNVGKKTLLSKFADNINIDNNSRNFDFKVRILTVNNKIIKVQICDMGSQEKFNKLNSSYFRGLHAVILIYDSTNKESFNNINYWISEIDKYAPSNVNKLLIGNKCDLTNEQVIDYNTGKELANKLEISFYETNKHNKTLIEEIFKSLIEEILERVSGKSSSLNNKIFIDNKYNKHEHRHCNC